MFRHHPENSTFAFGSASLAVDCLWRIFADGKSALTSRDHDQSYGLPRPVDAHVEALARLSGRTVLNVQLRENSADLQIEFEGNVLLEVIRDSSGYEPWNLRAPGVHLVALGSGEIADLSPGA